MAKEKFHFAVVAFATLFFGSAFFAAAPAQATADEDLYEAVTYQDVEKIGQLLAKGANVNFMASGRSLLGWAAQGGSLEVVQTLIKAGAKVDSADTGFGQTPLMRAIDTQQVEIVRELLKAKASPNAKAKDGKSCLMMAVESRKPEIVQALINAGANVKEVTPDGESPVLAAAQDGMSESLGILKILGKAGAELNASNAAYTPLIYAISQGNKELVELLLQLGADPNKANSSGQYPIMRALDDQALLSVLLKAKANPNLVTEDGSTPLFEAMNNRNGDGVTALLEAGADVNKKDQSGRTPVEVAEQSGQTEIAAMLKSRSGGAAAVDSGKSEKCSLADAAIRQMDLHKKLQAQVDAGKMDSDIFRTFNEDTKEFSHLMVDDPSEVCRILERLAKKYGV